MTDADSSAPAPEVAADAAAATSAPEVAVAPAAPSAPAAEPAEAVLEEDEADEEAEEEDYHGVTEYLGREYDPEGHPSQIPPALRPYPAFPAPHPRTVVDPEA